MTDKITVQKTDVSADSVTQELISSTSTNISALKASPVFGWLFAGTDLLSSTLDQAAGLVSQKLDETHEAIQSMQNKGLEVESELKRVLNPFAWMDSAQQMVTSNPLLSLLPGAQKRQKKVQQIELLNAKVELLVEQVALLAAKEAAAKAKKAPTAQVKTEASKTAASTAPKAASRVTSTKRSTGKTAASKSTATKPTSKAAPTKSSGAKATTARKRTTTATKASSAKEESTVQDTQSTENKST